MLIFVKLVQLEKWGKSPPYKPTNGPKMSRPDGGCSKLEISAKLCSNKTDVDRWIFKIMNIYEQKYMHRSESMKIFS